MAITKHYINAKTKESIKNDYIFWINYYAHHKKVEAALVKAIIKQESNFDINAERYEPHLRKQNWYTNLLTKDEKTNIYSFFSMGLMQQLYGMAKQFKYKGDPHGLKNPKKSIKYGIEHIKYLIKKYYYLHDVISAYNQGTPKKYKNGNYKNYHYVNSVYYWYKKYGGVVNAEKTR